MNERVKLMVKKIFTILQKIFCFNICTYGHRLQLSKFSVKFLFFLKNVCYFINNTVDLKINFLKLLFVLCFFTLHVFVISSFFQNNFINKFCQE